MCSIVAPEGNAIIFLSLFLQEALAALLPYLTGANDDYAYDYNTYSDDEGTWYDDSANADIAEPVESDDAALFQYLINHRNGRYSLEDLENLEREAEMEDNTENQLHALLAKKVSAQDLPQRKPFSIIDSTDNPSEITSRS